MKTTTEEPKANPTAEVREVEFNIVPIDEAVQSLEIYGTNPFKLELPKALPKVDFIAYGKRLATAMEMGAWRVGDYAKEGVTTYGMSYEELAAETGFSEGFLRNCKSVADQVPAQYRIHGMEKMRLMLGRKGDKETIAKLVKRLGGKSQTQLRKMAASGNGPRPENEDDKEVSATGLYESVMTTIDLMERFDTKSKLVTLASFENDKDNGKGIFQLARFAQALSDQLEAEHPAKAE